MVKAKSTLIAIGSVAAYGFLWKFLLEKFVDTVMVQHSFFGFCLYILGGIVAFLILYFTLEKKLETRPLVSSGFAIVFTICFCLMGVYVVCPTCLLGEKSEIPKIFYTIERHTFDTEKNRSEVQILIYNSSDKPAKDINISMYWTGVDFHVVGGSISKYQECQKSATRNKMGETACQVSYLDGKNCLRLQIHGIWSSGKIDFGDHPPSVYLDVLSFDEIRLKHDKFRLKFKNKCLGRKHPIYSRGWPVDLPPSLGGGAIWADIQIHPNANR